jgi:hypothetical protein
MREISVAEEVGGIGSSVDASRYWIRKVRWEGGVSPITTRNRESVTKREGYALVDWSDERIYLVWLSDNASYERQQQLHPSCLQTVLLSSLGGLSGPGKISLSISLISRPCS